YRDGTAAVAKSRNPDAIRQAEHGSRLNCIAPGPIPTAMTTNYDMAKFVRLNQPLQRQGMPIDVAYAALYLASEKSAQVTGLVLPVDGGTTVGNPANLMSEIAFMRRKAPAKD